MVRLGFDMLVYLIFNVCTLKILLTISPSIVGEWIRHVRLVQPLGQYYRITRAAVFIFHESLT